MSFIIKNFKNQKTYMYLYKTTRPSFSKNKLPDSNCFHVQDDSLSSSIRGCSFTIEHYAIESVVFIAIFPIDLFLSSI